VSIAIPSYEDFQGMRALWAMQVPAFQEGVRLISGSVAQCPLNDYRDGIEIDNAFLTQPEPDRPYWVTMQRTVSDLVLHGKAYWRVTAVDSQGFPRYVRQMPAADVSVAADGTVNGRSDWRISRTASKGANIGDVIAFRGFSEGVLTTGQAVLEGALALETAALNYATAPAPSQILKNTSGYELDDTEVDAMLAAYQTARASSSVAYLNGGVDLTTFGYSALDTQLVENRNQAAIQIARLLNLDPFWVGASISGSSLTYQNRLDLRTDLVSFTLTNYMLPIEQRLSMWDVTPSQYSHRVRFDLTAFLRANLDSRATTAIALLSAGIITQQEARAFISEEETGSVT